MSTSALFQAYKTNANKEAEGVEVPTVTDEKGNVITFIVARNGKNNTAYRKAFDIAAKPHRRAMAAGTMSNAVAEEMLLELFCTHILKGWRHVTDENGKELPFNKANARMLMTALPDLYDDLTKASTDASQFLDEAREIEAKN